MILLQITNDKIVSAFIGAAIALLLKFIYDSITEYIRLIRIRKITVADLENQKKYLKVLIEDFEELIKFLNDKNKFYYFYNFNIINTNTFKAFSTMDYFKAFEENHFKNITDIYTIIDIYSKITPFEERKKYLEEIEKEEGEIQRIKSKYKEEFLLYIKDYNYIIKEIDKFLVEYKFHYDSHLN
ncbi:MAG: hypothetical protein ACO1OF_06010 [Adhaeribacter sp.]